MNSRANFVNGGTGLNITDRTDENVGQTDYRMQNRWSRGEVMFLRPHGPSAGTGPTFLLGVRTFDTPRAQE
jgi:hypothetical protein